MGIESRNGRLYYYKKYRFGDKVISRYSGTKFKSQKVYELDCLMKSEELLKLEEDNKNIDEISEFNSELRLFNDLIASLLKSIYMVSGYYYHKGELRKMGKKKQDMDSGEDLEKIQADFIELITKESPTQMDLAFLEMTLNKIPSIAERYNLANKHIFKLIQLVSKSPQDRLFVEAERDSLEKDLGIDTASALEKLMIKLIVTNWLWFQRRQEQMFSSELESTSLKLLNFYSKQNTQAQNRLVKSMESLQKLRSMKIKDPKLQINIAALDGKQIVN